MSRYTGDTGVPHMCHISAVGFLNINRFHITCIHLSWYHAYVIYHLTQKHNCKICDYWISEANLNTWPSLRATHDANLPITYSLISSRNKGYITPWDVPLVVLLVALHNYWLLVALHNYYMRITFLFRIVLLVALYTDYIRITSLFRIVLLAHLNWTSLQ